MSDLIERKDAIHAIVRKTIYDNADQIKYECSRNYAKNNDWLGGLKEALEAIEEIPPAEPERRWIPCNAQMPEEREWIGTKRFGTTISDEVYVTFENPKGERFCKHLTFQNNKLSRFDQYTIDAFHPEAKPIAWMPLPEPYRGE